MTQNNKKPIIIEPKPITKKSGKINIGHLTVNILGKPFKARYHKRYKENKSHLIIDIVLAVIIVILVGVILNLLVFNGFNIFNLTQIKIKANPEQLTNGQKAEFTIIYKNKKEDTLTDLNLVVKFPQALHEIEIDNPEFDSTNNSLEISELAPKAEGELKIKALVLGNLGHDLEFNTLIIYKNRFGQEKQEFSSHVFALENTAMQVDLQLPEKIISSSAFETEVELNNQADVDLTNLKIKMIWPDNYNFQKINEGAYLTDNTWLVEKVEREKIKKIALTGKIFIEQPQIKNFKTEIYIDYNGHEFLLAQAENSSPTDFAKFKINLIDPENNQAITPGDKTTYTVYYKNEENHQITNLEIGLNLEGEYASQSQIRFNQNDFAKLAKLEPGEEGSLQLPVTAKSTIDFSQRPDNGYKIKARAFVAYDDSLENTRVNLESNQFVTAVSSRLSITTTGVFFTSSGDQIGVGSVPPVVGEYTSYWVIIKVVNTNNDLNNLHITAQIPDGVQFTDIYNVTAGQKLQFNQQNNTLAWNVEYVPAFSGINTVAAEARIQIGLIPAPGQAGTSPVLLTNIKATANDTQTGQFLGASGKAISTAIFGDPAMNKVIEY